MADTLIKVYDVSDAIVPQFSLTPDIGIAALDVDFIDEQFAGGDEVAKAYTSVDTSDIVKVYR